jgi:hypothetical protein
LGIVTAGSVQADGKAENVEGHIVAGAGVIPVVPEITTDEIEDAVGVKPGLVNTASPKFIGPVYAPLIAVTLTVNAHAAVPDTLPCCPTG